MARYLVGVREVHISTMAVDADDPHGAMEKVKDGQGEEILCEYSHTLSSDTWTVEDDPRPEVQRVSKDFHRRPDQSVDPGRFGKHP